jgi:hypothetical protein
MRYRATAAFLFTLAIASVAAAQESPAAKPTDSGIMDTSLQVTGAVIASEANRLVVKTDSGQEMVFIITDKQVDASMFRTGDRVTASYVTLAGTGAVVTKVVSAPAPVTTTTTTYVAPAPETRVTDRTVTKPAPMTTTTTEAPMAPMAPKSYESEPTADLLPATASPLPLVALLGLLGAGGAATIRRLRRP